MVDVTPKTRITIRVPKTQITYIAGKTELSYEQVTERIQEYLEFLKEHIIADVKVWIDKHVPKRTGQLRHFLKEWLDGSNITKNVLRIILGTYLPYADAVEGMDTSQVRHTGQKGYVYYPNIKGIRGPVILFDPSAVGHYFTEILEFMEEVAQLWIAKGKSMMWN